MSVRKPLVRQRSDQTMLSQSNYKWWSLTEDRLQYKPLRWWHIACRHDLGCCANPEQHWWRTQVASGLENAIRW